MFREKEVYRDDSGYKRISRLEYNRDKVANSDTDKLDEEKDEIHAKKRRSRSLNET